METLELPHLGWILIPGAPNVGGHRREAACPPASPDPAFWTHCPAWITPVKLMGLQGPKQDQCGYI